MKLNRDFITHESNGQQVMVATGTSNFKGLVTLNQTAAFIVECLKGGTTEETIVAEMAKKYDCPVEKLETDVHRIIGQLRQIGAIDE